MQSALFIGRFQPFHSGHLAVLKRILKENERVIIVIGSAEKNFLSKNPLTASERFQMIEAALSDAKIAPKHFVIIPVRNINNYLLWVNHLNTYVPPYDRLYTGSEIVKACFDCKYNKEHRANKIGPEIMHLDRDYGISASKIRQEILTGGDWESFVPKAVAKLMKEWKIIERIKMIKHNYIS